ncbi:arylsulfatase B-like, partial [Glandiceps talaboti]
MVCRLRAGIVFAFISIVLCKNKKPPHIIFIVGDDIGWNDVGYHNPVFKTPHIDSLAKSGVKLNNYYTGEVCVPSRNMLMSGRYAIRLGLQNNEIAVHPRSLPLEEVTIAEKLKESGYSTHLVGKWHCGFYKDECLPYNRGFDTFFGYVSAAVDHFTHKYNDRIWDLRNITANEGPRYNGSYSTHLFTREAERLIKQHDSDKPLFLYLAYTSNHEPLEVPPHYKNPFRSKIKDKKRLTLAAMSYCLDDGIGSVIGTLKSKGLYDNSVIVFISDNGGDIMYGGNNWPLKGSKATLWEGGVRVPAFVTSPLLKQEVRGTVCNKLFHVTDWFPTLVHLAGGNLDGTKPLDGFNQWETISEYKSKRTIRKDALIAMNQLRMYPTHKTEEFDSKNTSFDIGMHAAIRAGKWKLLTGGPGEHIWSPPMEMNKKNVPDNGPVPYSSVYLYDIENDPEERINLASRKTDVVKKILQLLGKYLKGAIAPNVTIKPKINYDKMGNLLGPW